MNRIHKITMTDEEKKENRRKLQELLYQILSLHPKKDEDRKKIKQLNRECSDLGDVSSSRELADSIKNERLAKEYRNRAIFQLKIEYEREKTDKASIANDLYGLLKQEKRREEAVMWFVRALRFGEIVYADGDKELLRKIVDLDRPVMYEEDLDGDLTDRAMDYLARDMEDFARLFKTTSPDILVCASDHSVCQSLIESFSRPDFKPELGDGSINDPDGEDDGSNEKRIYRITGCVFAEIIEAKTVFGPTPELKLPPKKTMRGFVRDIERERHPCELTDDSELSWGDFIDAVWYVTDGNCESFSDRERRFIRSMMKLPNAFLVVDLSGTVTSRDRLPAAIDALTDLVDPDRIVLINGGYFGQEIDARWRLIEGTKKKYKESDVFVSDEEKQELEDAWGEYFEELLPKWHARSEKNAERCIRHAAGRAQFIVEQGGNAGFPGLLREGYSLLKDLFGLVRGDGDNAGDDPGLKKDVTRTAELLNNIVVMIYELGGCCGRVAVQSDVTAILSACKASDLPEDAAAITYAVGMAAKAFFESGKTIPREALKEIYGKTKEEGLQVDFEPMHENDPATSSLFHDLEYDNDFEENDEGNDDEDEENDEGDDDEDDDEDGIVIENTKCENIVFPGFKIEEAEGDGDGDGDYDAFDDIDGDVMAAVGGSPDYPDNFSGKDLRLPDDYPSPGEILETDADIGGWGYTIEDAAVITGGIPQEHEFIEIRVDEELRHLEKTTGKKLVYADHNKFEQDLICEGNNSYDLLSVQIEVIPEEDWNQLKADWESHNGYKKDKEGRRKHMEWRESRILRFTEQFWFNVNALFDFGDDDDDWEEEDTPDGKA